ncbi:MAG: oxidoreductase [Roseovarius sp.]|nr:oxidoreductase [Roseovarius sp.]
MTRAQHRLARLIPMLGAFALVVLALANSAPAHVDEADQPALLTVVIVAPDGTRRRTLTFDRAALAALPQSDFTTHTIWTDGPQHFSGVALAALLAHLGVTADRVELDAVNLYTTFLPGSEIGPDYPVIAHSRNGKRMSLRDMGPFWLVYNYDADPAFRTRTTYARSIWQLDRITVHLAAP